ncbi:MAG: helix-hairpin-helix domain-containing protein [bacterium]
MGEHREEIRRKININVATMEDLMRISWIGEGRASAILRYRANHGPLLSLDELREVGTLQEQHISELRKDLCALPAHADGTGSESDATRVQHLC